ncbi:MAG: SRPBCC family protein [Planctomyces sp.]|nr:SRPBCC family protein [Planctomyces sp.]
MTVPSVPAKPTPSGSPPSAGPPRGRSRLKRVLLAIGGIFVVLTAVVLVLAARKPHVFRMQRSITIQAPPERIYESLEDFRNWGAWSPYEKLDPNMQRTYGGAERGVGATYAWSGDSNAGEGRMEIMDATPPNRLALSLDFTRPMEASNVVVFTLEPTDSGTQVTWSMEGPNPFLGRIIHVLIDVEGMVGEQFDEGLANLKRVAETSPETSTSQALP